MKTNKYPAQFLVSILARGLSKEDMDWLADVYEANKNRHAQSNYQPTKQDLKIYKEWLDGAKIKDCQKRLGLSYSGTLTRLNRIGFLLAKGDIELK